MAEGQWRPQGPAIPQGVSRQASDRRVEPPLVVQNAMLTKDKKPFTYTPGGIDLSEISSPRLARRVERNAMAPGVAEVQRSSPPRSTTHQPLPPQALAAMQPALPVQVFPSGPPPPPPMPISHAPPPPPPMEPLPTRSFATNEGVFERPDMTKIIPENPMALLKRTPRVQRNDNIGYGNVVDEEAMVVRQQPVQRMDEGLKTSTAQLGSLYIPPVENLNQTQQNQKKAVTPPVRSPPTPQAQVVSPPPRGASSLQSSPQSPPQSPMATLTRGPRPWQNQKPQQDVPTWAQRETPTATEPQIQTPVSTQVQVRPAPATPTSPAPTQVQVRPVPVTPTSPAPTQVHVRPTPATPTSPAPTQVHVRPSPATPSASGIQPQVQIRPPGANVIGRVIIPVQMDGAKPTATVDAVYVTQPVVLQHPGDQNKAMSPQEQQRMVAMQKQQEQQRLAQEQQRLAQEQQERQRMVAMQKQQEQQRAAQEQQERQRAMQQQRLAQQQQQGNANQGQQNVRIIPIQIEGGANGNVQRQESNRFGNASPATPGTARVFTRQPSWGQGAPTQSNSFKVIQKLTNTDGDDDDDDDPSEHPPRNSQQFQQQAPVEQTRKMVLNDGDRELMNKVKQGVDQEVYLHKEADPRYKGAAIPSKAFRFLQTMTGEAPSNVPKTQSNQGNSTNNNVRVIPVKMEGEPMGNYVPPSEQTVQEPKKYTGGKIPSRSFKMLQAMTGDPCGPDQSDL